jgi:hypothetical protein
VVVLEQVFPLLLVEEQGVQVVQEGLLDQEIIHLQVLLKETKVDQVLQELMPKVVAVVQVVMVVMVALVLVFQVILEMDLILPTHL